jgi:myo-inositol 2-dehydrogenase / D-chiro-inositol 1-dehydrogenase
MRIGVLGMGRIGHMHARNLAQTAGVDDVVLMGRNQARFAVSVEHVSATIQPDAPSIHRRITTSTDRPADPPGEPYE